MSKTQEKSVKITETPANDASEQTSFKAVLEAEAEKKKRLQIFSATSDNDGDTVLSYNPEQGLSAPLGDDAEDVDPILALSPVNEVSKTRQSWGVRLFKGFSCLASVAWLGFSGYYGATVIGFEAIAEMPPHVMSGLIGAVLTPLVLLWMIVLNFSRKQDVEVYAQSLKAELHSILFPTEERSVRVHRDIEKLVEQSSELAASSKAVLKSIHRARQGLRIEMRGFATLTKKGEYHISQISEQLNNKAEKALSMVEEIEARMGAIDDHSDRGIKAWDKATKDIIGRADKVQSAMDLGTKSILDAAQEATNKSAVIQSGFDDSVKGINKAVETVYETLDTISGQFDENVERLTSAAERVSVESSEFATGLEKQLDEVDSVTNRASEVLAASKETLNHQRGAFEKATETLGNTTSQTANTLNDKVSELYMVAEHITSEFDGFEDRVNDQAAKLSSSVEGLNGFLKKIEVTGNEAFGKLSEAVTTALTSSENMSATVRRSVDSIKQATKDAEDRSARLMQVTVNETKKLEQQEGVFLAHIKTFSDSVEENVRVLDGSQAKGQRTIEDLQGRTDAVSEKFESLIGLLNETLDGLDNKVASPLQRIEETLQDVDMAQESLEETMTKRVAELTNTNERTVNTTKKIRDMLKGQAQDIATISGQISGHAQSIEESLLSQKESFEETVQSHVDLMGQVSQTLEEGQSKLSSVSEKAQGDLLTLNGKVTTSYQNVKAQQEDASIHLDRLVSQVEDKTTEMSRLRQRAVQDISSLQATISETVESAQPLYQEVVDRSEEAHSNLVRLNTDVRETFETTLDKLKKTGIAFEEQSEAMAEKAGAAHKDLVKVNTDLEGNRETIKVAVKEAERLTSDMLQDFQDRASDIHLVADQANLRIESVQKSLQEQLNTLSDYVGQAMSRMSMAENGFSKASNNLSVRIQDAEKEYAGLRETVKDETEQLSVMADDAVKKAGDVVRTVKDESKSLLTASESNLSNLKQIGDSISVRTMELTEQMRVSLDTSKNFAGELRKQASQVADASHHTVDQISVSISDLMSKADKVGNVSRTLTNDIGKVGQELKGHAKDLRSVSETAVLVSSEASASFAGHTETLRKASQEALDTVKDIKESELRYQRDAFLSGAKFVMESLYSLSVDLVRHIKGGEIDEKDMKSYERGDLTVFTKRLIAIGDKFPEEAVKDKFTNDTEFRTYVQRFIRQFEEIFDQAVSQDHGSILSATMMASDLGKVYMLLCQSTGRSPRTPVKH